MVNSQVLPCCHNLKKQQPPPPKKNPLTWGRIRGIETQHTLPTNSSWKGELKERAALQEFLLQRLLLHSIILSVSNNRTTVATGEKMVSIHTHTHYRGKNQYHITIQYVTMNDPLRRHSQSLRQHNAEQHMTRNAFAFSTWHSRVALSWPQNRYCIFKNGPLPIFK